MVCACQQFGVAIGLVDAQKREELATVATVVLQVVPAGIAAWLFWT
jgi:hypothetical protein